MDPSEHNERWSNNDAAAAAEFGHPRWRRSSVKRSDPVIAENVQNFLGVSDLRPLGSRTVYAAGRVRRQLLSTG